MILIRLIRFSLLTLLHGKQLRPFFSAPLALACLVCLLCLPGWAGLPQEVRVRLLSAYNFSPPESVTLEGPFEVLYPISRHFPGKTYRLSLQGASLVLESLPENTRILTTNRLILRATSAEGIALDSHQTAPQTTRRFYPDRLIITPDTEHLGQAGLSIVNALPSSRYVSLVVASETPPDWPKEALKAQAVLTQSRLSRYRPGDILPDSTQWEAYRGLAYRRPEVDEAVRAVAGEQLYRHGRPIIPFYHAACAGKTSAEGFFSGKGGKTVVCSYCRRAAFSGATHKVIPQATFEQAFPPGTPRILKRDAAGRPLAIQLGDGRTISGYDFWIRLGQKLGWDKAPGAQFSIERPTSGDYQITSTGGGHGVGMCQWGASAMARRGKTYRQILHFYFPDARTRKLSQRGIYTRSGI